MVSSLMCALEEEYICLREISINVNKLLAVLLLPVLFIRYYTALCCCLFASLSPFIFFFILMLLYFCLFVDHVNKPINFVFGAFFYNFKNTISIFVTVYYCSDSNTSGGVRRESLKTIIYIYTIALTVSIWLSV